MSGTVNESIAVDMPERRREEKDEAADEHRRDVSGTVGKNLRHPDSVPGSGNGN